MENYLPLVNELLGWGDDQARVWFVGIEEHDEWTESTFMGLATKRRPFLHLSEPANSHQINQFCAEICLVLGGLAIPSDQQREAYRRDHLWRDGSGTCHANLRPLGKNNLVAWPKLCAKLFQSQDEYHAWVVEVRYPYIASAFFNNNNSKLAICFGKRNWFKAAFGLTGSPDLVLTWRPSKAVRTVKFFGFKDKMLVLAPFFGRGWMGYEFARNIGHEIVNRYGAQLQNRTVHGVSSGLPLLVDHRL